VSDQDKQILKNEEQDPDVEGHRVVLKNDENAEDVARLNSDEEPDVEGHRITPKTRI
jgi:hypothetical protein